MKKSLVITLVTLMVVATGAGLCAWYCSSLNTASGGSMPKFKSREAFVRAYENGRRDYPGYYRDGEILMDAAEESVASGKYSEAPQHSTTNVQVENVDEADIVKTDGEYIYTVSGQSVFILSAYPPRSARVVSSIDFDGRHGVSELLLEGDRLVVIGTDYGYEPVYFEEDITPPTVGLTSIDIYDISDRESPQLTRTIEYEGDYSTSRKVGDNIYLVLTTYPEYYLYDGKEEIKGPEIIPVYRDTKRGQRASELRPVCGCTDVEYTDPDSFSSFLSVITVSLKDGNDSLDKRVIAGYSESVYASTENLYVVSEDYRYPDYGPEGTTGYTEKSTIYKFKLDGPRTTFLASAEVPGTVLNQFSMDEHLGFFRIATSCWKVGAKGSTSVNNVYVLDPDLAVVGVLEGLAPGETIYSARFMGNKAYLVTFEQIDPFFVLDLTDPGNPRVLGSLKIPGYSEYLHPLGENHIIGIGKDTVGGDPQGVKIAVFDVSDFANPEEIYMVEIGDSGTDSYALQDHRAFLFDDRSGLLVMPILLAEITAGKKGTQDPWDMGYGQYTFQGAYVYDVSPEGGIEYRGRVTHLDDPYDLQDGYYYGYDSESAIKRSLYIGESLYTVSEAEVKANSLNDLSEEASIRLVESRPE